MSADFRIIEPPCAGVASGLVELNNAMLQVDMHEAVDGGLGGPFDESRLWAVHL